MTVYEPGEDSFLLKEHLEEMALEGKKVLEIGTGSGILAFTAAEKSAEVSAVDINTEGLERAREESEERDLEIDFIESDLFENIEGLFDLIIFNPPYLPREKKDIGDEEIWSGGEKGVEVSKKFLRQVNSYLEDEAEALIVLSSKSEYEELVKEFSLEIVEEKKLWFEVLYLARYK